MAVGSKGAWRLPLVLTIYGLLPLIPGVLRLVELGGGLAIMPDNPRALADPLPIIVHILAAMGFTLGGAWQFSPALRRNAWHRRAGRLLAPLGIGAALSGVWMALFYPPTPEYGPLLTLFRVIFGNAMAFSLVLAVVAIIMHRDVPAHRAWMIRGYALGLGATTQIFVLLPLMPFGTPAPELASVMMAVAWLINLAVAEWVIRRKPIGVRQLQRA